MQDILGSDGFDRHTPLIAKTKWTAQRPGYLQTKRPKDKMYI